MIDNTDVTVETGDTNITDGDGEAGVGVRRGCGG
jgi:hypothetical protein